MTLVKWSPNRSLFNLTDDLFTDFFNSNRMVTRPRNGWMPVVDVEEDDNGYHFTVELPGLSKDDVKISFQEDVLTITGEKKGEKESKEKNYHYVERRFGKFERSFRIHSDVILEKIDANFKDGILTIDLPKAEIAKPKQIEVKVK